MSASICLVSTSMVTLWCPGSAAGTLSTLYQPRYQPTPARVIATAARNARKLRMVFCFASCSTARTARSGAGLLVSITKEETPSRANPAAHSAALWQFQQLQAQTALDNALAQQRCCYGR